MPTYKMADIVFSVECEYKYFYRKSKEYLYNGDEKIEFTIKPKKIDVERYFKESGLPLPLCEDSAILEEICTKLIEDYNGFIFHSSTVEVGGQAFMFAAPSGTGKSTLARHLKEYLNDKIDYINDDKPFVRKIEGKFYAYGNCWNGKHGLGKNGKAEIKAIALLERGSDNIVENLDKDEAMICLLRQTLRPKNAILMSNLLNNLAELVDTVEFYRIKCIDDISAAETVYKEIIKR